MTRRTLVLGGARSGKSAHAEGLLPADADADYLATARRDPDDAEWTARIAAHARRRPGTWRTVEVPDPVGLGQALRDREPDDPPVLVDDMATWLTSLLDDVGGWEGNETALRRAREVGDGLLDSVAACRGRLVLVSAEVGLGVVPPTRSGRLFRDELGSLNAGLADRCDEVLLLVAGIPLRLR